MDKFERDAFIDEKIDILERVLSALRRIKGTTRSESAILRELDINQRTFRKAVYETHWQTHDFEEPVDRSKLVGCPTKTWQEDLFCAIMYLKDKPDCIERIPSDVDVTIDELVDRLPDRDRTFVRLYYQERLSYEKIGILFGVSIERVRQLHEKILKQLRAHNDYINMGHKRYISQKTVHDALEADYYIKIRYDEIRRLDKLIAHKKDELSIKNRKDLRLIDVGLSNRVFGILHRAGLRHLGDICVLTEKEVKSLPGVGGKALDEIKEMMSMHRVTFAKEEE